MSFRAKLLLMLAGLALLTPLGLLLPHWLGAGGAWGEWGPEELRKMVGYLPPGIRRLSGVWQAPIPDYSPPRLHPAVGYLVSGAVGMAAAAGLTLLLGRLLARRK